jgi:cation diffusion facilitator CzcD-associated flavoprotein CzcO
MTSRIAIIGSGPTGIYTLRGFVGAKRPLMITVFEIEADAGIRNTSSPHWRGWLKPENRCLVPFNSFAEYAPEPNPETKKKDVVWFALNEDRPLMQD